MADGCGTEPPSRQTRCHVDPRGTLPPLFRPFAETACHGLASHQRPREPRCSKYLTQTSIRRNSGGGSTKGGVVSRLNWPGKGSGFVLSPIMFGSACNNDMRVYTLFPHSHPLWFRPPTAVNTGRPAVMRSSRSFRRLSTRTETGLPAARAIYFQSSATLRL